MIFDMKKSLIYLVMISLFIPLTHAFQAKKCWDSVIVGPPRAIYEGLGGKDHKDGWLIKVFGVTTGSATSTLSYVSSTSACSSVAQIEREKIIYIAMNHRRIQIESATGQGESLDALAYFYGHQNCLAPFKQALKVNYQEIFSESENLPEIDFSIQRVLKGKDLCSITG